MRQIRRAENRGHANHDWLDTWHSFSFADYFDPQHLGFRALRVINDDHIAGGAGFGAHPHREMEILTFVLSGQLLHRDSMGHTSTLSPGDWQRISAGTGMVHSEHNANDQVPVHLYQIWIVPQTRGLAPTYEERRFDGAGKLLIASQDGRDGSLAIRQDALVYLARLSRGELLIHELNSGRHAWLQVVKGGVQVGEDGLRAGDGLAISDEREFEFRANDEAEVIIFDLA